MPLPEWSYPCQARPQGLPLRMWGYIPQGLSLGLPQAAPSSPKQPQAALEAAPGGLLARDAVVYDVVNINRGVRSLRNKDLAQAIVHGTGLPLLFACFTIRLFGCNVINSI